MKTLTKHHLAKASLLFLFLTAVLGTSTLFAAWTAPGNDPTASNALPPLNVGNQGQSKSAGLSLTALLVNGPVRINDGTQQAGRVLVSNGSGVASWQDPPAGGPSLPTCSNGHYLIFDAGISEWVCTPNPIQNRVSEACPGGQAIRSVNADGTVVCENVSGAATCTYNGKLYHEGAACRDDSITGISMGCSSSNPDSYRYRACTSGGNWDKSGACYDANVSQPMMPNC